jgi:hypothetical protein
MALGQPLISARSSPKTHLDPAAILAENLSVTSSRPRKREFRPHTMGAGLLARLIIRLTWPLRNGLAAETMRAKSERERGSLSFSIGLNRKAIAGLGKLAGDARTRRGIRAPF